MVSHEDFHDDETYERVKEAKDETNQLEQSANVQINRANCKKEGNTINLLNIRQILQRFCNDFQENKKLAS